MLNLLGMLTAPVTTVKKKQQRGENLRSLHDAQRRATENRYRLYLEGAVLTTNELAERMGVSAAGISKTLNYLARRGILKRIDEHGPQNHSGRPPVRWTWSKR